MEENNIPKPLSEVAIRVSDKNDSNKLVTCLKTNILTLATVGGVICGIIVGIILKETVGTFTKREVMYVSFIGDVFLRMLKSLILPLIVSSLISAIASLDISLSGRIAARAILFYLTTTFMAVVLGIILVATIQPGSNHSGGNAMTGNENESQRNVTTVDTLLDLVRYVWFENFLCIQLSQTFE